MPKSVLFEERIPENILELQCATEVAEIILENDTCRYWITYGCSENAECGVRSAECGVRSAECGVRSAESKQKIIKKN